MSNGTPFAFTGIAVHAAEDRADDRILGRLFLSGHRRPFQVERHGVAQELDVRKLFRRRRDQKITVLVVTPRSHRLEEILHRDANFALDAADRLLEKLGEYGVRAVDTNFVL